MVFKPKIIEGKGGDTGYVSDRYHLNADEDVFTSSESATVFARENKKKKKKYPTIKIQNRQTEKNNPTNC